MINYNIYFKNNNGLIEEVLTGCQTDDLNDISRDIEQYENEQPELLENGEYIVTINIPFKFEGTLNQITTKGLFQ